jgi:hypothetical protein
MRTRTSLTGWGAALLAGLGLPSTAACGGTVESGSSGNGNRQSLGGGESGNPPPQLRFPCANPKPLGGGFVACDGGFLHRPAPVDCPSPPAPTSCAVGSSCQTDSECGGGMNRCLTILGGQCECWDLGCHNDTDCAYPGEIAVCQCGDSSGTPGPMCQGARCKSDAECGGFLCASATEPPVSGCGTSTFACQTASDECMVDSDCVAPAQCFFDGGKRVCEVEACRTGRPFLVGGAARTADVAEQSSWSSIGMAPHIDARLAFCLASAYGGRPIGPGALDVRDALDAVNVRDTVRCVIAEGCIGETIAAAEAVEALDRATDPAVRSVLTRIAADERRHAELAWQFVKWALDQARPELRAAARDALFEVLASDGVTWEPNGMAGPSSADDVASSATSAHGILPDSARRDVAEHAFMDVVRPCAMALLRRESQARAA